ncbi:MAG: ferritin family protein [Candidatus Omnitrophica bacterium]|nr:ferritin family protein [Candidatus Omnitrophota bacterium]MBU1932402.1 ferritin family protein [Candidatus Omnitrophota bacterium]
MGNIFTASEIAEMGVKIEENGRDFYQEAARKSKNESVAKVFELLAGEEEDHIRKFEAILSRVKKYEPSEAYPNEYFSYIRSLSGEYVFTKEKKGAQIAGIIKTDKEAVDLGIGFEKDSILFYEEMKKFVLEEEKSVVDKLLEQEKIHLRKLNELRRAL